jgi:hypothetical protein
MVAVLTSPIKHAPSDQKEFFFVISGNFILLLAFLWAGLIFGRIYVDLSGDARDNLFL